MNHNRHPGGPIPPIQSLLTRAGKVPLHQVTSHQQPKFRQQSDELVACPTNQATAADSADWSALAVPQGALTGPGKIIRKGKRQRIDSTDHAPSSSDASTAHPP